jgi:hypothetical protein
MFIIGMRQLDAESRFGCCESFIIIIINKNIGVQRDEPIGNENPRRGSVVQSAIVYTLLRSLYEKHKKKLLKIYEDRKSQLGYNCERMNHIGSLKSSKIKSFIYKFNDQHGNIAK